MFAKEEDVEIRAGRQVVGDRNNETTVCSFQSVGVEYDEGFAGDN